MLPPRVKITTRRSVITAALRMDSSNSNAVRGLANVYRAQSPEKASQFIQSLSASQRRSIDDIERSLTNEQLSARRTAGESGKYAQAAEIQRRRLALSPGDVWITYRLSRDLYSAGQRSRGYPDAPACQPETV